jgi:hypothetical protein
MAHRNKRRVSGNTTKGDRIVIFGVSANGTAEANARAKGCFGKSWDEKQYSFRQKKVK